MPDLFGFGSTVNNIGETLRQSMADQTKNNETDAGSRAGYNSSLINLLNADVNKYRTQNDIAVKNPATFAKQAAMADFLSRDRVTNSGAGGGPANLGATGRAALADLQKQAIDNLLNAPKDNPVPKADSVKDPRLANPALYAVDNVEGYVVNPRTGVPDGTGFANSVPIPGAGPRPPSNR